MFLSLTIDKYTLIIIIKKLKMWYIYLNICFYLTKITNVYSFLLTKSVKTLLYFLLNHLFIYEMKAFSVFFFKSILLIY